MHENMIGKKSKNNIGFTLVETLVAISILSLSILAGFTAVQNGIKSSLTAKNQITAFYLVQEAMEIIKNVRDENALAFINGDNTRSWLYGMSSQASDECYFGKTCYVDSTTSVPANIIQTCSGVNTTCPYLRMDSNTGLWGYTAGWTQTNFKRAVTFQNVSTDEVAVTVWISWTQGATTKSFQVTQSLFNRLQ